jgi:hypothetical protein
MTQMNKIEIQNKACPVRDFKWVEMMNAPLGIRAVRYDICRAIDSDLNHIAYLRQAVLFLHAMFYPYSVPPGHMSSLKSVILKRNMNKTHKQNTMKVFIELWKAKDAWKNLPLTERQEYVAQIGPVTEDMMNRGLEITAWGLNEDETEYKSEYDFFAVSKLPSEKLLKEFQSTVEAAGWYDYFEQVNLSGSLMSPEEVIGKMLEI